MTAPKPGFGFREGYPHVTDATAEAANLPTGLALRAREMAGTSARIDVTELAAQNIDFLGLDGDDDADYALEYYCISGANGNVRLQPNEDAVNVESRGFYTNGIGAVTQQTGASNLLMAAVANGTILHGFIYFQSRKNQGPRLFASEAYQSNDHYMVQMEGVWTDTTTALDRIRLSHTGVGGWGIGSWAILRKLLINIPTTTVGGGSPAAADILPSTRMAVLGDSIPSPVYNTFQPIWDAAAAEFGPAFPALVNAGQAGNTVQMIQVRTQADIVDQVPQPNLVIVYMGRNNLATLGDIPNVLLNYGRTLDIMILGGVPAKNIVCCSVIEGEDWMSPHPARDALNTGISGLAALRGCVYADLITPMNAWEAIHNPGNDPSGHMLIDTSHPNATGIANISDFPTGWMWASLTLP
jgi:hypothetical protein